MSLYDYKESMDLAARDYGFYPLIMAAMRKADDINACRLRSAWPDIWIELKQRYNAPGGIIEGD